MDGRFQFADWDTETAAMPAALIEGFHKLGMTGVGVN
jgi:hypothetical protein